MRAWRGQTATLSPQTQLQHKAGDNSTFSKKTIWIDAATRSCYSFMHEILLLCDSIIFRCHSVFTSHNCFYPENPQNPSKSFLFISFYCRRQDGDLFSNYVLFERAASDTVIRHIYIEASKMTMIQTHSHTHLSSRSR